MKFLELLCLFRKYIKSCFKYVKIVIKSYIMKLFLNGNDDYSNNWELYVKRKENEHEIEKQKAKSAVFINLIQVVNKFKSLLLLYCQTKNEEKDKLIDAFCNKFEQVKGNFISYTKELEQLGGVVPNELKALINETKMDAFNDMNAYREFSSKIDSLKEQIR